MNNTTQQVIQSSRYLGEKGKVTCVCCDRESFDNNGYCSTATNLSYE